MNPVKNNLVALGSAAVLAVYAAGYVRTKSAAERFAGEDAERRRAVATTEHAPDPQAALPALVGTEEPGHTGVAANQAAPTAASTPAAKPVANRPAGTRRSSRIVPVATPAATTTLDTATVTDSTLIPHGTGTNTAAVASPTGLQGAGVAGDTTAQPPQKERGQFKDGAYSGWGTSRHGDIQATVEIRDGHIVAASISQCLTRYSCSWIAGLPPQVVVRQSANVDYISGATQSTNAFYYAIAEALSKAK